MTLRTIFFLVVRFVICQVPILLDLVRPVSLAHDSHPFAVAVGGEYCPVLLMVLLTHACPMSRHLMLSLTLHIDCVCEYVSLSLSLSPIESRICNEGKELRLRGHLAFGYFIAEAVTFLGNWCVRYIQYAGTFSFFVTTEMVFVVSDVFVWLCRVLITAWWALTLPELLMNVVFPTSL